MPEPVNQITDTASLARLAGEAAFDPIEERLRMNVRAIMEAAFEEELAGFPGRLRYAGGATVPRQDIATGTANGHSPAPSGPGGCGCCARIEDRRGKVTEWRSKALPRSRRPANRVGKGNVPVGRLPCEG
jgi:hypothetical protein